MLNKPHLRIFPSQGLNNWRNNWEGRYKATLIDSESYLLTCMRYIELNPVRAGMVADPVNYPWSSYRFNALRQTDSLVTPHFELQRLGNDDGERQAAYRALFNQTLSETQINKIREATNKAWALGESRFKERIQLQLARRVKPAARGGDESQLNSKSIEYDLIGYLLTLMQLTQQAEPVAGENQFKLSRVRYNNCITY